MLAPVFDQASDIVHEEYPVSLWKVFYFNSTRTLIDNIIPQVCVGYEMIDWPARSKVPNRV